MIFLLTNLSLRRILATNNLTNVIKGYSRVTASSKTLIDHIITSNPDRAITAGSFETCISDHNNGYAVFKLKTERTPQKLITVSDYKSINKADIQRDLQSAPWNLFDIFNDVDDAAWCCGNRCSKKPSHTLKQRKIKVRAKNEPWVTRDIRKALNNRFELFKKAIKLGKNTSAWSEYKTMKNYCTKLIRTCKTTYWKLEFQKCTNAKSFWNTVNKFQGKSKSNNIGLIMQNNQLVINNNDKANVMNSFLFQQLEKHLADKLSPSTNSTSKLLNFSHIYQITPTTSAVKLDDSKIEKAFKSFVKIGKAIGPDGISSMDLKFCEDESIRSLQKGYQEECRMLEIPQIMQSCQGVLYLQKRSQKQLFKLQSHLPTKHI